MKKIVFIFILLAKILYAYHVVDSAGVFSMEFEKNLEQKLSKKDLNVTIFVLTLDSIKNSKDLRRLNEKLTKADKNPFGVVVSTKHRKFWLISDESADKVLYDDDKSKPIFLYPYPFFIGDDYESGVSKLVNGVLDGFNSKDIIFDIRDYEVIIFNYHINFFLVLLMIYVVIFVILNIVAKDKNFFFLLFMLGAALFASLSLTLFVYGLFSTLFVEILVTYPSIILAYIMEYDSFVLTIMFIWLFKILLHRGLHLEEYREKARKENEKYMKSRSYRGYSSSSSYSSSYSSSSSYSGGGGSFGGGGASGSW